VNLFGRDILVSGRLLFGGTNTFEVEGSYPWITGNHVSVDARAAYLIRDDVVRGFEETSTEITPWLGTFLGQSGRLNGSVSWFRMESDTDGITLNPNNRDDFLRVGARLGYDTRDSWRVPRRGWKNEIEVWGSAGAGEFLTFTTDVRRYQPWGGRQTFAMGALMTLQSGTLGVDVPTYLDYYMGGANSIRGYDPEQLGEVLFGKNQLISTVEYRYALVPLRSFRIIKWSFSLGVQGAGFVDLGTAWSDQSQLTGDRFRVGWGFGLRLIVPNNEMIRFDLGFSESGVHFHFGTWSKFTAQRFRIR
jgi:outer membrane protein assembly factor BamA